VQASAKGIAVGRHCNCLVPPPPPPPPHPPPPRCKTLTSTAPEDETEGGTTARQCTPEPAPPFSPAPGSGKRCRRGCRTSATHLQYGGQQGWRDGGACHRRTQLK
jgi:hypothetical protein